MMPFELAGVRVARGAFTLKIPALTAEPGTVIGLVGPNGAGKSTLLRLLAGMIPGEGEIRVLGADPRREGHRLRARVGWMSDDMPIWSVSIAQLLRMTAGFYPTWDEALAQELLQRFELDPRVRVATLSKGDHTRIRLVLTLAFRPELVLLDEPATGLDVKARRALLELLLGVVRDGHRTVVLASHQVDDVERVADRVILLERGEMVADGTAQEVAGKAPNLEERLAGASRTGPGVTA